MFVGIGILLVDVMWFILGVSTLRVFVSFYSVCPVPIVVRGTHAVMCISRRNYEIGSITTFT